MIMSERSSSSNLLCCGFDKRSRSSDTVELLASSSWKLLLKRVGDVLMVYLLMNTSLFIPLPQRKYLQVAGFPISSLCQRFSNEKSSSGYQHISQSNFGSEKKGEVYDEVERRNANKQASGSAHVDLHSSFCGSIIGSSERTNASPLGKHCGEKCYHKTPSAESAEADEKFIQAHKTSRKRKRPTSWQRRRNHRQLNSEATNMCITHSDTLVDKADGELVKEEIQGSSSARVDFHSSFSGSITNCSEMTNASPLGKHCGEKCYHKTPYDGSAEADAASMELCNSLKSHETSIQAHKMSRKRKRPTSWQRRRKRQLNSVATNSCITHLETRDDNGDVELVKEDIHHLKDWREKTSESVKLSRKSLRQYSWQRLRKNVKLDPKVTSSLVPCSVTLTGKHTASSDLSSGLGTQQSIPFEKVRAVRRSVKQQFN